MPGTALSPVSELRSMQQTLSDTVTELKITYPGVVIQYRWIANDTIHLDVISVPKTARNTGVGSTCMATLVGYARTHGVRVMLVADSCFGSDLQRLREFYRRFGFHTQGRKMVFREMHQVLDRT